MDGNGKVSFVSTDTKKEREKKEGKKETNKQRKREKTNPFIPRECAKTWKQHLHIYANIKDGNICPKKDTYSLFFLLHIRPKLKVVRIIELKNTFLNNF